MVRHLIGYRVLKFFLSSFFYSGKMLYRLLKLLIGIGVRLYYRQIKVKNVQFLEHHGPMIIIANHPNTLMDAWIIGQVCSQPIHFLAKGTFFNSPIKRWFLSSLNMIPINRQVDGNTAGVNNNLSFEACYKVLEAGKTLVIFPEGNSIMERQLRELKTGTARIALEVQKRNNGNLNLLIVPVGIFYSQAEKFRSSVFVNFGKGKLVKEAIDEDGSISVASKKLTARLRLLLEQVLVSTESKEQETLIQDLSTILLPLKPVKDIEGKADLMKEIKIKMEEIQLIQPYLVDEIQQLASSIKWKQSQLKIKSDFTKNRFKSKGYLVELFTSVFFVLIGFPVFVFGIIHSILPFKLTEFLMTKLIKNIEYYAPIAVLLGLVLYPLNYILLFQLTNHYLELNLFFKIIYFISMPLTGMFAYYFVRFLQSFSFQWKYSFLVVNQIEAMNQVEKQRKRLSEILFENRI